MTLDRVPSSTSVIDVLDHVLDKGIVIDAWLRVSLAGIDLLTVEARVVVATIGTYLSYAGAVSQIEPVAAPIGRPPASRRSIQEQLRRVREAIEGQWFEPQARRRAEDRVRDELHDRRATTIKKR